ncbi:MAG: hypothetical protein Q9209_004545 [Squamulea sp. 1 TL-2023]
MSLDLKSQEVAQARHGMRDEDMLTLESATEIIDQRQEAKEQRKIEEAPEKQRRKEERDKQLEEGKLIWRERILMDQEGREQRRLEEQTQLEEQNQVEQGQLEEDEQKEEWKPLEEPLEGPLKELLEEPDQEPDQEQMAQNYLEEQEEQQFQKRLGELKRLNEQMKLEEQKVIEEQKRLQEQMKIEEQKRAEAKIRADDRAMRNKQRERIMPKGLEALLAENRRKWMEERKGIRGRAITKDEMTPMRAKKALGTKKSRTEEKDAWDKRSREIPEGLQDIVVDENHVKGMEGKGKANADDRMTSKSAKVTAETEGSWIKEKYRADSTKSKDIAAAKKEAVQKAKRNEENKISKKNAKTEEDRSLWNEHLDRSKPRMIEAMAQMEEARKKETSKGIATKNSRIEAKGVKIPPRLETHLRGKRTWQEKLAKRAGKKVREERRKRNEADGERSGKRGADAAERKRRLENGGEKKKRRLVGRGSM